MNNLFSLHGPSINLSLHQTNVLICSASLCVGHMNLSSVTQGWAYTNQRQCSAFMAPGDGGMIWLVGGVSGFQVLSWIVSSADLLPLVELPFLQRPLLGKSSILEGLLG